MFMAAVVIPKRRRRSTLSLLDQTLGQNQTHADLRSLNWANVRREQMRR